MQFVLILNNLQVNYTNFGKVINENLKEPRKLNKVKGNQLTAIKIMDAEVGHGGFPATHTTTTTTSTSVITSLRLDPDYVKGLPGGLKCAQMVLDLLGFICVAVAIRAASSTGNWFSFVAMGGFWITLILFIFFLYHVVEKFYSIPWLMVEWVYCGLWTFFYFTAATAAAVEGKYDGAFAAAAFFGYAAMLAYLFDAYLKFISWKAGEIAQGDRITKTSTVNSPRSPAY